jgi:PAS domain S-box-containing protein
LNAGSDDEWLASLESNKLGEPSRSGPSFVNQAQDPLRRAGSDADALAFLAGGGAMGARIRAYDWSRTSLGLPSGWPQALRTSLRVLLTTNHPIFVFWGPELICFYNDSYSQSLGPEKHPFILGARGRQAWDEIWDIIGPQIDHVMAGRGATWHENQLVPITRHGHREDVYWTYSYGPIDDESAPNGVGGVLVICTETTRQVLAEQRAQFLLDLEQRLGNLTHSRAIVATAAQALGAYLRVGRCGYAAVEQDGEYFLVEHDWTDGGIPSLVGRHRLSDFGSRLREDFLEGRSVRLEDVRADDRTASALRTYEADSVRAGVGVPILKDGRLVAALFVHQQLPRRWGDSAVALVQGVAERTWAAIERARAEEQLRASNEELRLIADAMPVLISFVDAKTRYRFMNRCYEEWFGHKVVDSIGRTMAEVLGKAAFEAIEPYVRRALAGEHVTYEAQVPYRDGGSRFIHGEYIPLVRRERVEGFYVFVQDISLRRQVEEALREADRRKDEFLAMLAHELRNPLAPIRTAAQVLKLSTSADPSALRTSEIIVRQVEHMTEIVDDLLDVSRVTHGLVELNLEVVDVKQALAAAIEQIRPALESRRQRLTVDVPPDLIRIRGDSVRLTQIIGNLLGNAVKYTPDDGAITLGVHVDPAHVVIAVSDTGAGIAADLLPRIFDLFAQGDRTAARTQGGLGLGLALVKRLVELHKGTVEARSPGPGRGSQFVVRLPRADAAAAEAAQEPTIAVVTRPQSGPLQLMVVDDNKDAAAMLAMLLRMEGHEVSVEHDAHAALARAMSSRPSVMLLDIGLPSMDGLELARRLRANPLTASCTLIALTGYGRPEDRLRSRDAGFDHHLVKPVDPSELMAALAGLTERRRQVQRGHARTAAGDTAEQPDSR